MLGCEISGISVLDFGQTLFDGIPVCGGSLKALRNFGGRAWKGERVLFATSFGALLITQLVQGLGSSLEFSSLESPNLTIPVPP